MTVYVLENGCYSDTRVVGVYSSQANADLAATQFKDDPAISSYEVDIGVSTLRKGGGYYFVRLHRDTGDTLECHLDENSYGAQATHVGEDIHKNLYTQVWAMSPDHAVKIAADRRRMFLAAEAV